jgi:hypothetical protein
MGRPKIGETVAVCFFTKALRISRFVSGFWSASRCRIIDMDIREHCISSVFFHVIAVLLLAAISQFHPRVPPALTVSLYEDSSGPMSTAAQAKIEALETAEPATAAEEKAVETTEPPADERVTSEEKPPSVTEPVRAPETPQTAAAGMTVPGQEVTRLARIHHAFAIHAYAFVENASQSIQKALHREIESDPSGGLSEGTAEVMLYFNDEGGLGGISGATSSEKLQSLLGRLDWKSVPLPGDYRLKMKGLHVKIKIDRGEPSLFLTVL